MKNFEKNKIFISCLIRSWKNASMCNVKKKLTTLEASTILTKCSKKSLIL